MASFVESATLKVVDQSSAQISKINAELKKLQATAKSLKSQTANLGIKDTGFSKVLTDIKKIESAMRGLKSAGGAINVRANTSQAMASLIRLQQQARQPIQQTIAPPRAAPGGAGGYGRRGFGAPLNQITSGFMQGFSFPIVGLGVLGAAAYTAAAALKAVGESAARRDRTLLQSAAMASDAQRGLFERLYKGEPPPGEFGPGEAKPGGPLPLPKDQFQRLWVSLLGDVQGTEEQRAKGAFNVAKYLAETVIPRIYAQRPEEGPLEAMKGARLLVQGMNLASTDLISPLGQFTQDGLRVANAIQRAMSVDPEVTPSLIKTVLANAKTAALTLSEEGLTRMFLNAGARGQRAGNETFRAIMAATGTIDNKSLNEGLIKMGLITDFERKPISAKKARRGEKGAMVPGSGTPAGGYAGWAEDPALAFRKYFVPKMIEDVKGKAARAAFEEKEKAGTGDLSDVLTTTQVQNYLGQTFKNMNAAAKQGIFDLLTGFDQMRSTLEQSQLGMAQDVPGALAKSWVAQWENVKTNLENTSAGLGELTAAALGAAEALRKINQNMKDPKAPGSAFEEGLPPGVATGAPIIVPYIEQWLKGGLLKYLYEKIKNLPEPAKPVDNILERLGIIPKAHAAGALPAGATSQAMEELQRQTVRLTEIEAEQADARARGADTTAWDAEIGKLKASIAQLNATFATASSRINDAFEQFQQPSWLPQTIEIPPKAFEFFPKPEDWPIFRKGEPVPLPRAGPRRPVYPSDKEGTPVLPRARPLLGEPIKFLLPPELKQLTDFPATATSALSPLLTTMRQLFPELKTAVADAGAPITLAVADFKSLFMESATVLSPLLTTMQQTKTSLAEVGTPITTAASELKLSADTFAEVFGIGTSNINSAANTLSTAGAAAAADLLGSAYSIGGAIGDAAAARISAAAVNVNVNNSGSGANKGHITEAG